MIFKDGVRLWIIFSLLLKSISFSVLELSAKEFNFVFAVERVVSWLWILTTFNSLSLLPLWHCVLFPLEMVDCRPYVVNQGPKALLNADLWSIEPEGKRLLILISNSFLLIDVFSSGLWLWYCSWSFFIFVVSFASFIFISEDDSASDNLLL